MTKQKFHAFTFIVTGDGRFPIDMMRYDRCVPRTQDDVAKMIDHNATRRVEMIAYTPVGNKLEPTGGRWISFGWGVVENSVKPITVN